MLGHIAAFTIEAGSEDQMESKIKLVQQWFENHLKIVEV